MSLSKHAPMESTLDMGPPCSIRHKGSRRKRRAYAAPILNIFVPHTGHLPSVAGRPFFMVICVASFISRLVLHLTQYACGVAILEKSLSGGSLDRSPAEPTG